MNKTMYVKVEKVEKEHLETEHKYLETEYKNENHLNRYKHNVLPWHWQMGSCEK